MKKFMFLFILMLFSIMEGQIWYENYSNAHDMAIKKRKPLISLFYSSADRSSKLITAIVDNGNLDFLSHDFILSTIDLSERDNHELAKKLRISEIPVFILKDYNNQDNSFREHIIMNQQDLLFGLYEYYNDLSRDFIEKNDNLNAYRTLDLIDRLPDKLGKEVKRNMKKIRPSIKDKNKLNISSGDSEKAETYWKTARFNYDNERYSKAYIYYEKIPEIVPGTELAKKAAAAKDSIKDKIDSSKILK